MTAYARGAIAGAVATLPMTIVMVLLHRRLTQTKHLPEPPIEITAELARRARVRDILSGKKLLIASLAAHFAFGAATGAAYAPLAKRKSAGSNVGGIMYGLGIWTISYLGWVPRWRIMPPATRQPPQRNALMLLAHVAWGATLAVTTRALGRYKKQT